MPRNKIEPLCHHIASNFNPNLALPSDWNFDKPIHYPSPLEKSQQPPKDFLDWIDVHISSPTKIGLFESNEAQRGNRPVSVNRKNLIDLWRRNGGSICRVFGMHGI